jgi:hypothetical protein
VSARPRSVKLSARVLFCIKPATYPAGIRVKKSPPDTVCADLLHASATVEENSQHTLSQVDYLLVLLCVGGIGGIISHGVLFWDRRYDQSRV